MFVVQGIERHGNISLEFFFKDKKNIMKNVIEMANFYDVKKVIIKQIVVGENDEDISETILTAEAFYFKK